MPEVPLKCDGIPGSRHSQLVCSGVRPPEQAPGLSLSSEMTWAGFLFGSSMHVGDRKTTGGKLLLGNPNETTLQEGIDNKPHLSLGWPLNAHI